MEINLNNYEAFFLDYYEGKLNKAQTEELFRFLEKHPELNEEFYSFENITLENSDVFFNDKNTLIKPEVTHYNYENYLIAEAEGDLTTHEKRALDNFLAQHPEYNKDRDLYSKIKANPDKSVFFNLKENLRKTVEIPGAKIIYLYRSLAVAASIVLAVFFFVKLNNNDITEPVAEVKKDNKANVNTENKTEEKRENKNNSDTVFLKQETQSTVEEKMNLTVVNEKVQRSKQINPQENTIMSREIREAQFAIITPEKKEPEIVGEKLELPQATVLEIADKILLAEEKAENLEVTQPTLAQAAVNTIENMFSGSQQAGEANVGSSIVELAANSLNKLADEELVTFEKKYNDQGQLKKFHISAGNFSISRSKSR